LTAADVNGVPSWNLTPDRSTNVQVRPSGVTLHDVASEGTISPFAFHCTSPSNTALMMP